MNAKKTSRTLLNSIAKYIGAEAITKFEARLRFHKHINIYHPVTLTDKINYLEYKDTEPLRIECSDKYAVREYIRKKGYSKLLVPLLPCERAFSNAHDINFSELPDKFVIKATYGCQMNIICPSKSQLNLRKTLLTLNEWLEKGYNRDYIEPHYRHIPRQIIIEEYLENADDIIDYKIHCLNGKPEFILTCSERPHGLKLNLYDLDWNPIHEIQGKHVNNKEIPKPNHLEDMITIATNLCKDFRFVRVDLYQIKNKIYFGELTFFPDGGMLSYFTDAFDAKYGKKLSIL